MHKVRCLANTKNTIFFFPFYMFYFFELQEYLFLLGQQSYSLPCVIVTSVHILIVMYHSKKKKKGPVLMSDIWFWELSPKLSNCAVLSKLLNFFMTHWLKGREFEQISGDGEGQGSLACCSPWGSQRVGHDLANEQQQFYNLFEKGRKKRKITIISVVLRMA